MDCKTEIALLTRLDSAKIGREYGLTSKQVEALSRDELFPCPEHGRIKTCPALWERTTVERFINQLRFGRPEKQENVVYFVGMDRFIKIGFTTYLERRLRSMRTWSPYEFTILAAFQGTHGDEKTMHRICRKMRVRDTEWFDAHPSLKLFIWWLQKINPNHKRPNADLSEHVRSTRW